ncbi:MAG: protein-glutamate O-methyltransferase CheR [Clostridia bacterium]|nr:protein-glutamate O-methyltransferase CheR [Clostridia bacterium]
MSGRRETEGIREGEAAFSEVEWRGFLAAYRRLTGQDLAAYRREQLERRLRGAVARLGGGDLAGLVARMEREEAVLRQVVSFLTIHVSGFFRNPEQFERLRRHWIPRVRGQGQVSVWSAGCASGPEPYSLAILLAEAGLLERSRILATDIDDVALARARAGEYAEEELAGLDARRRAAWLERLPSGLHCLRGELRRAVRVERHDLLTDPPPGRFDLVLCRNVLIYFTPEGKERALGGLAEALRPGGWLLLGSTESLYDPGRFGLRPVGPFLYEAGETKLGLDPRGERI